MKPIQFAQSKKDLKWKSLVVTENISSIHFTLRDIKHNKRVPELLYEYYSILFNNTSYFRTPYLSDLTLLFPTAEPILIQKDTNFILLPLPLPSYREYIFSSHNNIPFRKSNPCVFISSSPLSKEIVRDMDYSIDNPYILTTRKQRSPDQRNINAGYQHTNPAIKQERLTSILDVTARVRTYSFQDLFPNQAISLPNFPRYSLTDYSVPRNFTNQLEWYNAYAHRQYTFLEITPANSNWLLASNDLSLTDISNKLQNYCKYLIPEQLSLQRAKCFSGFNASNKTSIIKYFSDYPPAFQYSPVQIKTGIKRLKNIIKYKKPTTITLTNTSSTSTEPSSTKFNQHIRSLNIKQSDWTFNQQLVEDMSITRRTPINDIKPLSLSTNDNPNG